MGILAKYVKSYIKDKEGHTKGVIIDYSDFLRIEELVEDYSLVKAMEEVEDDEVLTLEKAKKLVEW